MVKRSLSILLRTEITINGGRYVYCLPFISVQIMIYI